MRIDLSEKQNIFLNQYFKNPTKSINQISKITSISQITLKNYFNHFKEIGFLKRDHFKKDNYFGMRVHSDSHALFSPENLNLQTLSAYIEISKEVDKKEILSLIRSLPYLTETTNTLIPNQAMIIEFILPSTSLKGYQRIFSTMQHLGMISNLNVFITDKVSRSHLNFQKLMQIGEQSDYHDLEEKFSKYYMARTKKRKSHHISEFSYDHTDIKLIRELQINANLSLTSIEEHYDKDISTLSRRINAIREEIISDYSIEFDSEKLNFQNFVIMGNGSSKILDTLNDMIDNNIFWFESTLMYGEEEFLWSVTTSMRHFIHFQNFIDPLVHIKHSIITNDRQRNDYINPDYFDKEGKSWTVHDEIIKNTIQRLNLMTIDNIAALGTSVDAIIEKEIDIHGHLHEKYLDFIDFIELLQTESSMLLNERELRMKLKITNKSDLYLYKYLLHVFGTELSEKEIRYLENLITNVA